MTAMTPAPRPAAVRHPRQFTAATWNVYHGTPRRTLEPVLARLLHPRIGVSLIFAQETDQQAHRHMFRDAGLHVAFAAPQYLIAWDPDVWAKDGPSEAVRLSSTPYFAAGSTHERFSEAVMQRLTHQRTEKVLAGMSYHTPPSVQVANQPPARIQALRESAASWRRLSREALRHDGADAALFAGDDNVDERLAHGPWGFMLRTATGLRQVQAPSATHGRDRRIDDFRVRGDLGVLDGFTMNVPAPDDHRVHVRHFRWR